TAIITIERTFDEGTKRDEWSQMAIDRIESCASVDQIVVELGKCPIISSTVIAGLVHLYDYSNKRFGKLVCLRHCTQHVIKILDMMQLKQFFVFENPLSKN
ncbi:MAG: hypothetical protein EA402_12845, partial [Planctomycetota bacterium]